MKKLDSNKAVTLLANFAVVAGILFLALEIQQANRIAIASSEIGIRNSYSSLNREIYSNTDVAELLSRAKDPAANFSPVESLKLAAITHDFLNVWLSVETACSNFMAPPVTCKELKDDIRSALTTFPATLPEWREIVDTYPSMSDTEVFKIVGQVLEESGN